MQDKFNLLAVQNALGYVFKNPELIKTAFIHKSYEKNGIENNARLVLVGQKLFDFVICDYTCTHSSAKGERQLIDAINGYSKELNIAQYAKKSGLLQYLTLSALNEPIRDGTAVGNELFYAITAAIYKDGGLPALKGFLLPMLRSCGTREHYEPASEGKVISRADADVSTEKHIQNAKLRPGKKGSVISVAKAETVNLVQEKPL
jgi:dsRNA-specific ribonuclease